MTNRVAEKLRETNFKQIVEESNFRTILDIWLLQCFCDQHLPNGRAETPCCSLDLWNV